MEALKADRARQVGTAIIAAFTHAGQAEEGGYVTEQCPQTSLIVLTGKDIGEFLAVTNTMTECSIEEERLHLTDNNLSLRDVWETGTCRQACLVPYTALCPGNPLTA